MAIRVSARVVLGREVLVEHNTVTGAQNTFSRKGCVASIHTRIDHGDAHAAAVDGSAAQEAAQQRTAGWVAHLICSGRFHDVSEIKIYDLGVRRDVIHRIAPSERFDCRDRKVDLYCAQFSHAVAHQHAVTSQQSADFATVNVVNLKDGFYVSVLTGALHQLAHVGRNLFAFELFVDWAVPFVFAPN